MDEENIPDNKILPTIRLLKWKFYIHLRTDHVSPPMIFTITHHTCSKEPAPPEMRGHVVLFTLLANPNNRI